MFKRMARKVVMTTRTGAFLFVGSFCLYGMYSLNDKLTGVPEVYARPVNYETVNHVGRKVSTKAQTPLNIAAMCLAANIYFEARGEPLKGQLAVGQVTFARAKYDRDSVCRVVMAKKQFSWVNDKPRTEGDKMVLIAFDVPEDRQAWENALMVARRILRNKVPDVTEGSNHYHAVKYKGKKLTPKWIKAPCMHKKVRIGNHIFYKCTQRKFRQ